MKKFLKIGAALAAVCFMAASFVACDNGDSGSSGGNGGSVKSLKSIIRDANDGDVIDLGAIDFNANDRDSYTVSKDNLTIKNGNVRNATFVVTGKKVKFENLKDINSVIVDEAVGDDDFTMQNCHETGSVYVNGGGSNSVHIAKTEITKLSVNKAEVRIVLEDSTKVSTVYVLEDCKLESTDETNKIGGCIVSENVTALDLAGKAIIEKLVSESDSNTSNVTITIATTFTVEAADYVIKSAVGSGTTISGTVEGDDKTDLKDELDKVKNNPPQVNQLVGRKLKQTVKYNGEVEYECEFEFQDETFTLTENGRAADTYKYTYDSAKKRIYCQQVAFNGMNLEEYCEVIKSTFEEDEYVKAEWTEAKNNGLNLTFDEYVALRVNAMKPDLKIMMDRIRIYEYTLGEAGVISKLKGVYDLSIQDWKKMSFEHYETNGTTHVDIYSTPGLNANDSTVLSYGISDNNNNDVRLYYYRSPESKFESLSGEIVFQFNFSESNVEDPTTCGKAFDITFSYSFNQSDCTLTLTNTKDNSESYVLRPVLETYTNGVTGN